LQCRHPTSRLVPTQIKEKTLFQYRASGKLQPCEDLFGADEIQYLRLKGFVIDRVVFTGDALDFERPDPSRNPFSILWESECLAKDEVTDIQRPELQDFVKLVKWHIQAGQMRDVELADPYLTGESFFDAFWLMLAGNTVHGEAV
jgi:hypothetical protein